MRKNIAAGLAAVLLLLPCATLANGGSGLTIASDSSSGTYRKMLNELKAVCGNSVPIQEADNHGGAVGNLQALTDNQVNAAFLHSDVYIAQKQADPSLSRFETLVALYPEAIHVLALKNSKSKKGPNPFAGATQFNSLADTAGFPVGAAGGGVFTLQIIQGSANAGFSEVKAYNSGDDVISALDRGEIAAAVFVGAAPLPNLQKLEKNQYKILPMGDRISSKLPRSVYHEVTINYSGLTFGPIKTFAPIAVILTRKYNTGDKVQAQRAFRNCFNKNLNNLKDNASPSWQNVTPGDHGPLPWLKL